MRYLFVLAILGLSVLGCRDKPKTDVVDSKPITKEEVEVEVKEVVEIDPCIRCDSTYNAFPKDSASFEKLYGYPDGLRYDGYEDISELFTCLDECFRYEVLLSVVKLQSNLEYNADATSHIRHGTSELFMDQPKEAKRVLSKLSCSEFYRFFYFSFDRIARHDSFYSSFCKFLLDLQMEEPCKVEVLNNYCVLKNVETDEH